MGQWAGQLRLEEKDIPLTLSGVCIMAHTGQLENYVLNQKFLIDQVLVNTNSLW